MFSLTDIELALGLSAVLIIMAIIYMIIDHARAENAINSTGAALYNAAADRAHARELAEYKAWLQSKRSIETTARTWEDIRPGYLEQRKQMQAQINKLDNAEYCPPQTGNGGYRPDPCQL